MSSKWLVLWAGTDAHWGRLDDGGAFGPHVETGQIASLLAASSAGVRDLRRAEDLLEHEVVVDVTAELDARSHCRAVPPLDAPPQLTLLSESPVGTARALTLPGLPALLGASSKHLLAQLAGASGVLGVPDVWRAHPAGSALLQPWLAAGWRIGSWDSCAERAALGRRVISLAADGWARTLESSLRLLLPPSAEVATAAALTPTVCARLKAALLAIHGDVVADCEEGSWFTRTRVRRLIADALVRRLETVTLGGASAPVLTFPAGAPGPRQVALAHARFSLALPRLNDADWWSGLTRPGVVSMPDGGALKAGLDWSARPTVFFGAKAAEKRLQLSFQMNGYRSALETPPTLPMFAELDAVVSAALPLSPPPAPTVGVVLTPAPGAAAATSAPSANVNDLAAMLAGYRAGNFSLSRRHHGIRAMVEGRPASVRALARRGANAPTEYQIQAAEVPQGAIIRVDYELEAEV